MSDFHPREKGFDIGLKLVGDDLDIFDSTYG